MNIVSVFTGSICPFVDSEFLAIRDNSIEYH